MSDLKGDGRSLHERHRGSEIVYDVVVVGAGTAGVGAAVALKHAGIENFVVSERHTVGASFASWLACRSKRLGVHVGMHEYFAGCEVRGNYGDQPVLIELGGQFDSFLTFYTPPDPSRSPARRVYPSAWIR